MRSIVLQALATTLLAGCAAPAPFQPETPPPAPAPSQPSTPPPAPSFEAASLAGSEWIAKDVGGIPARPELQQKLQFVSASQVAGFGGCNSFTSNATTSGSGISFGPLATTKKACAGEAMAQESFFFGAIQHVRTAKLDNGRLLLQDQSGKTVLVFAKSE